MQAEGRTETHETYEWIAAEYARRNSSPAPELLAAVAAMSADLPAGSLVVDVGCGPGREIRLLREQGLRVVGLDLSMAQLRAGSQSGVRRRTCAVSRSPLAACEPSGARPRCSTSLELRCRACFTSSPAW